jgi:hypothetical protein
MINNRTIIMTISILGLLISIPLLASTVTFDSKLISAASAATLTVMNTNDSGPGSLRAAIIQASPGDTIVFAPSVRGTITLTTGQLVISKSLTITGPGAESITISGNHANRIIQVDANADVNISGLAIAYGYVEDHPGSAIDNNGVLTVSDSHVFSNIGTFLYCYGCKGGAIHNSGILTLTNTSINANTYNDYAFFPTNNLPMGGINNEGTAWLLNVRIYENLGGVLADYTIGLENGLTGVITATNSQIYGNGIGVRNNGLLHLTDSWIHHNNLGISNNGGRFTLLNSQVYSNTSSDSIYPPGGGVYNQGDLLISNSQIVFEV